MAVEVHDTGQKLTSLDYQQDSCRLNLSLLFLTDPLVTVLFLPYVSFLENEPARKKREEKQQKSIKSSEKHMQRCVYFDYHKILESVLKSPTPNPLSAGTDFKTSETNIFKILSCSPH